MKYENFEDLYKDNFELIEYEFKSRFYEMFNMILDKIDWYQEKEHEHIDGGNCSSENDYYRKNIINLERIYEPLYNFVHGLPGDMIVGKKFPMVTSAKHAFIDAALPTENEINREYRGKLEYRSKLQKLRNKQLKLADILECIIVWAYELGRRDSEEEPKDVYNEPENFEKRNFRLSELQTYAKDSSFAKMIASLYGAEYEKSLKMCPDDFDVAAERSMLAIMDFLDNIKKDTK